MEKNAEAQTKSRQELSKITKEDWTAKDFEDPGRAFNKLLQK